MANALYFTTSIYHWYQQVLLWDVRGEFVKKKLTITVLLKIVRSSILILRSSTGHTRHPGLLGREVYATYYYVPGIRHYGTVEGTAVGYGSSSHITPTKPIRHNQPLIG